MYKKYGKYCEKFVQKIEEKNCRKVFEKKNAQEIVQKIEEKGRNWVKSCGENF